MSDLMWPFFTFYGGKWRAAPKYPEPTHETIIEPFAGSAGYSLRYPDRQVVLVEKDPAIAGTWRYLIEVSEEEILALPDIGDEQDVRDLGLCQEAEWLVGWWLNKGTARPSRTLSAWGRGGLRPNQFWGQAIRERIASQVPRIRHWRIIEGDYSDAPDCEATWFIDPPYEDKGVHYKHGCGALDFAALADWCRSRRGQVVVCEQSGADWLPFRPFATIKANESKHGKKTSKEVVWLSGAA